MTGINAPYIAFFVNSTQDDVVNWLYNNIYSVGQYQDLWFYWQGKPLLMAGSGQGNVSQTIKNFFTWKNTWAFQSETQNQWRFIDDYPQRYSWETNSSIAEQICVSKSMGAPLVNKSSINNKGSSFHNGIVPTYDQYFLCPQTPLGLYFQEQWDRALSVNPSIVTVTGWNELTAGAWNMDAGSAATYNFMGKPLDQDPGRWYFVDEFNMEFNRDIEPMKGGYTDNYYYQLVSNIRKYKGMNPSQAVSGIRTINIDGNYSEWVGVYPVYKDPQGDTLNRNFKNVNNSAIYVNNTGRNDVIESRVSCDTKNVYFNIKTANNITGYTSGNWMLLYIDSDNNKATGWNGYDHLLNATIINSTNSDLRWWNNNQWNVVSNSIKYNLSGNQMEITLPRININQVGSNVSLSFHVVDNVAYTAPYEDTFVNGDSAPDRRFNYKYTANIAYDINGAPINPDTLNNITEGIYSIKAKHSGKCMDVEGTSLVNGANVHQWGYLAAPNQKWNVIYVSNGYYKIISVNSNKALTLDGTSTADGVNIFQWDWLSQDNQLWKFEIVEAGYYKIVNKVTGKIVDVSGISLLDDANIQQWGYVGGENQKWRLDNA